MRQSEFEDCLKIIEGHTVCLNIHKEKISGGFIDDLKEKVSAEENTKVYEVHINDENGLDRIDSELRSGFERIEISKLNFTIPPFSVGFNSSKESTYKRLKNLIQSKEGNKHILFLKGDISQDLLRDLSTMINDSDNFTVITESYTKYNKVKNYRIGRFDLSDTEDYVTQKTDIHDPELLEEIHNTYNGNPEALRIAIRDLPDDELKGNLNSTQIDELWNDFYLDNLTESEKTLLNESFHMIDLQTDYVSDSTGLDKIKCEEILERLRNKGIVTKEQKNNLYTTDMYLKEYVKQKTDPQKIYNKHRKTAQLYIKDWIKNNEDYIEKDSNKQDKSDVRFVLALYHMKKIFDKNPSPEKYVNFLEEIDPSKTSGLFMFGVLSQQFFFDDPEKIVKKLSKSSFSPNDEIANVFDTIYSPLDEGVEDIFDELSKGWKNRGQLNKIEEFKTADDETIQTLLNNTKIMKDIPPESVKSIAQLIDAIGSSNKRELNENFRKFGKTAEKYGLTHDSFTSFIDNLHELVDFLYEHNSEMEGELKKQIENVDEPIRTRTDIKNQIQDTRTQTQKTFDKQIEKLREGEDQLIKLFNETTKALPDKDTNPIFRYVWLTIGDELLLKSVLGTHKYDIVRKRGQYEGFRKDFEEDDENSVEISYEDIQEIFTSETNKNNAEIEATSK